MSFKKGDIVRICDAKPWNGCLAKVRSISAINHWFEVMIIDGEKFPTLLTVNRAQVRKLTKLERALK